jgi:hypothetical protein
MKYTVVTSDEYPQVVDPRPDDNTATTPTQLSYSQSQNSHHYSRNSFQNGNHNRTVSAANSTHSYNHIPSPTYPPPRHSGDSLNYSPPPTSAPHPPPSYPSGPPPLPPKTPLPYPDEVSPVSAGTQPSPRIGTGPATFMNMGDLRRTLPYPVSGVDQDGYGYGGGFGDDNAPPPSVNMRNKPTISR